MVCPWFAKRVPGQRASARAQVLPRDVAGGMRPSGCHLSSQRKNNACESSHSAPPRRGWGKAGSAHTQLLRDGAGGMLKVIVVRNCLMMMMMVMTTTMMMMTTTMTMTMTMMMMTTMMMTTMLLFYVNEFICQLSNAHTPFPRDGAGGRRAPLTLSSSATGLEECWGGGVLLENFTGICKAVGEPLNELQ